MSRAQYRRRVIAGRAEAMRNTCHRNLADAGFFHRHRAHDELASILAVGFKRSAQRWRNRRHQIMRGHSS